MNLSESEQEAMKWAKGSVYIPKPERLRINALAALSRRLIAENAGLVQKEIRWQELSEQLNARANDAERKLALAVEALRFYARRQEDGNSPREWNNWADYACDKLSGQQSHFDWHGDEADTAWEIAEKALTKISSKEER